MNTSSQPPSGAQVHHSFELDSLSWWKRSGVWIVGILVIAVAFFSFPPRGGCRKSAVQVEAVNNARQIGLALSEFEKQYGSFPDTSTIGKVRQENDTDLKLGTKSSNDFFRQLLAANIVQSESMFFAMISGTHKPDHVFTGAKALEKGECGFTYFLGATKDSDPKRPLAITPMIPGTDRFDPKPFKGKAVVLRMDNSVTSILITKDGHVILEGKNLMDPANPIWQGKPPMIAWPE